MKSAASWMVGCASVSWLGCQQSESSLVGTVQQSIIYGDDDRIEGGLSASVSSIVALIPREAVEYAADGGTRVSFESAHGLCAGERFAEQPALSHCTGVLVAPDLVITAAHCLDAVTSCRDYVYVRNYYLHHDDAGVPPASDFVTLECESTLATMKTSFLDDRHLDFAVLRLSQPAERFIGPVLRYQPPVVGEAVMTIGTSGGLPFKATSGVVLGVRPERDDYFDFTGDVFIGGSGSGVFDAEGSLLGIHVRGARDFELTGSGCWRSRTVAEDGTGGTEQANSLGSIIDTLCRVHKNLNLCERQPDTGAPEAGVAQSPPADGCADSGASPEALSPGAIPDRRWPIPDPRLRPQNTEPPASELPMPSDVQSRVGVGLVAPGPKRRLNRDGGCSLERYSGSRERGTGLGLLLLVSTCCLSVLRLHVSGSRSGWRVR